MTTCYIALGSNLDNPHEHVRQAFMDLVKLPETKLISTSKLYSSKALLHKDDPTERPDYINAAAKIYTTLAPMQLLDALQSIEIQHGRPTNRQHWPARPLDLDLLLYDDLNLNTPDLTLPHPEMHKRDFVLIPLLEVEPHLRLPNGQLLSDIKNQLEQLHVL